MDTRDKPVYLSVSKLADDLTNVTGDSQYGKAAALTYAIYYKDLVIDTVRFQRGLIDEKTLELSRNIRWEHAKRHNKMVHKNMRAAGRQRPKDTATHHIVAWDQPRAAKSRIRLAAYAIDIDAECNGVYLPRYRQHCPHPAMPDALAYSKTHTGEYFLNVEFMLESTVAEGLGKNAIISVLREVGQKLTKGKFEINERV